MEKETALNRKNEKRRILYQNRLNQGLCKSCGKNPLSTKTLCTKCNQKRRDADRKKTQERIAHGLCGSCGKEPLLTEVLGKRCLEKRSKNHRKRVKHAEKFDICIYCKSRPLVTKTQCEVCRQKHNSAEMSVRRKRIEIGLCPNCGNTRTDSFKTCQNCREEQKQIYARSKRKRIKNHLCTCGVKLSKAEAMCAKCRYKKLPKDSELSNEEYISIIKNPCYYCNLPNVGKGHGIERLNNDLGHTLSNCVSGCGVCNMIRSSNNSVRAMKEFLGPAIKEAYLQRILELGFTAFEEMTYEAKCEIWVTHLLYKGI